MSDKFSDLRNGERFIFPSDRGQPKTIYRKHGRFYSVDGSLGRHQIRATTPVQRENMTDGCMDCGLSNCFCQN